MVVLRTIVSSTRSTRFPASTSRSGVYFNRARSARCWHTRIYTRSRSPPRASDREGRSFSSICYVEIGGNHPIRNSNTWLLYKAGCRGVFVEANPELAALLSHVRVRDLVMLLRERTVLPPAGAETQIPALGLGDLP